MGSYGVTVHMHRYNSYHTIHRTIDIVFVAVVTAPNFMAFNNSIEPQLVIKVIMIITLKYTKRH